MALISWGGPGAAADPVTVRRSSTLSTLAQDTHRRGERPTCTWYHAEGVASDQSCAGHPRHTCLPSNCSQIVEALRLIFYVGHDEVARHPHSVDLDELALVAIRPLDAAHPSAELLPVLQDALLLVLLELLARRILELELRRDSQEVWPVPSGNTSNMPVHSSRQTAPTTS